MGDNKFIVVSQELFNYLTGVAVEIFEDDLELDDLVNILYEVYFSGNQDAINNIIQALEGTLELGCE